MANDRPAHRPLWQGALVFVLILGAGAWFASRALAGPEDFAAGTAGSPVTVVVESGDTLRQIGGALHDAGVIASVDAFVQATESNADARYITAGDYRIARHLPASAAIKALLDPASRDEIRVVIPEGIRAERVYAIVAKAMDWNLDDVRAAFAKVELPPSAGGKVEGYLFPATYSVKRSAAPSDVAALMVNRFRQAATELELERRARAQQLSVHDVMVIASLVEGESAPKDFAKVARVILNRLKINMPLQLDSSVNYGLGGNDIRLSQSQLDKDTPYNTYLREGLPPTPIGNPGEAAIEAALSPARGDWLYFVTTDTKRKITEFAVTYDEFLDLKAKFLRNN